MTAYNALLAIENLTGGYGQLRVFWGITFAIHAGEAIGITGPNGAGKTTLLKTMIGLLPAFDGKIVLAGTDVTRWPTHKRVAAGMTLVPEGRQILGTLTVRDNLELTQAARSTRGHDRYGDFASRLDEVLTLFPRLRERLGQTGGSLSGGEQQMLAVARALMTEPIVILLDEPLQGLAPVVVKTLRDALISLKGRFAMVIVEQNRGILNGLVDRLGIMRSGKLEWA